MPVRTPDGRYIIVRGRLWRAANPHLPEAERERFVADLMDARRAVKAARAAKDADGKRRPIAPSTLPSRPWANAVPSGGMMGRRTRTGRWQRTAPTPTGSPPGVISDMRVFSRAGNRLSQRQMVNVAEAI